MKCSEKGSEATLFLVVEGTVGIVIIACHGLDLLEVVALVQFGLSVVSAQVAAAELQRCVSLFGPVLEVEGFLQLGLEVLVFRRAGFTTAQKVVDVESHHGDQVLIGVVVGEEALIQWVSSVSKAFKSPSGHR